MAEERRTDRRTLQRLADLAQEKCVEFENYSDGRYWRGVLDGLSQALGHEIFSIQTITTQVITIVTPSTSAVPDVAASAKSTPENDTNGI
jgi:hypothetical protein